ncbi:hypothetical protein ANRL1_00330 [Anaerolineae bacterium]|nr:hypothetical protein ANRL1_00330 [Anaerolineae bacterium]
MGKLLYRVDEAMVILAISRRQVYQLVADGELVGHNDNPGSKGMRVTAESINLYFEKYQVKKD